MTPDLNPENDPLLMATVHAISYAKTSLNFTDTVFRILADYHSALRTENAKLRAQVEELLALRPPAPIIIQKREEPL